MSMVPPPAAIENTIMPIVSGRLRIPDSSASFSLTVWNLQIDRQQDVHVSSALGQTHHIGTQYMMIVKAALPRVVYRVAPRTLRCFATFQGRVASSP